MDVREREVGKRGDKGHRPSESFSAFVDATPLFGELGGVGGAEDNGDGGKRECEVESRQD